MMSTGVLPLAPKRWQPNKWTIDFEGQDFTGATVALQVRLYRDAPGDPLLSLSNATSPAEGISVSVATTEGVPTSSVEIRVNETTIEGLLPFAVASGVPNREPGKDVALVWDLHITFTGSPKHRWLEGPFTIIAGVTQ